MGWLVSFLVALLLVSILAFAMPTLFGPIVAGAAPILVVVALLGLGGAWWRRSQHPVEPESDDPEEVRGEDEHVET